MVCAQRDYRRVTPIPNSSSSEADITPPIQAPKIRDYTTKEKLKVIAGATGLSVSLPLFPKKRKYSGRRGTSHLCQQETHALHQTSGRVAAVKAKAPHRPGIPVFRLVQSLVAATLRERGRSLTVLRRGLRQGARATLAVREGRLRRDQDVTRRET